MKRIPSYRTIKVRNSITPYNSYDDDDDEEPNMRMDDIVKTRIVEQLNSIYNQHIERMTKEELCELLLNKWKKRHEVTLSIQPNAQLSLWILEICAGDQDYIERISDVVDIINDFQLGDTVRDFIADQPIGIVPANGLSCSFDIYQINVRES